MPPSPPLPSPSQTIYRTALGYRILLGVAAPLLVAAIGYGAFAIWQERPGLRPGTLLLLVSMLLAAVFLAYSLLAVFKNGFVITSDRVIEQNMWPFASKELLLKEIAGFRINDKYTVIFPNQPDLPKLKIGYTTEAYQDLQFWLSSRYPDLDQAEAEATKAALLADEQLGSTPEERADRLALAKRVGTVLNIAGGLVAAWLFFKPQPYPYAIAAGVALPLLAAGALLAFPGFMRLEAGKNSPQASVALALLLPSFILVVRAITDGEPLSYAAAWPVVGEVGAAFAGLLLVSSRQSLLEHGTVRTGSGSEWTLLLMCAAAYGFGATLTANAAFDSSQPTVYQAQVLSKHKSTGKTTTYYLDLTPWGPRPASDAVTVSRGYYDRTQTGDMVPVAVRPGRLGITWFRVEE